MRDPKARIVIVGGGFAGVYAAMDLDRTLARRREAEVVLMSRENLMLFTPMLHEVAGGDLQPSDIVNPLRRILRHVRVVEAEVDANDLLARTVSCVAGIRDVRCEFGFDHVLLALGSDTNVLDLAGVRDWAATMKSRSDADLFFGREIEQMITIRDVEMLSDRLARLDARHRDTGQGGERHRQHGVHDEGCAHVRYS